MNNNLVRYIKKISLHVVLFWIIIAFIIYPNIDLVRNTFIVGGQVSLKAIDKLLSSQIAIDSLKNSFILAFSISITVNIIGIFIVLVTEFFDIKGSKILKIGYFTTMIYGGIVLVS
ncbi:ABC transporter permease, partial [Oceanivirga salmonicida]|uniref:ABC transporter permease n=1 Tax=Oceanivirga salmonicida TaxID=1769291 RepID=UPI0009EA4F43